jgi:hypothetical protein
MFIQKGDRYGVGSAYYQAKNPEFGATFTYFFKDTLKTLKDIRLENEKKLFKAGKPIPQPTKQILDAEKHQIAPYLSFIVKNKAGEVVRKINTAAKPGINRINWNLRYMDNSDVHLYGNKFNPLKNGNDGMLAMPGEYSVEMHLIKDGTDTKLTEPVKFKAELLNNRVLPAKDEAARDKFYADVTELRRVIQASNHYIDDLNNRAKNIQQALHNSNKSNFDMQNHIAKIIIDIDSVDFVLDGEQPKASWEEIPPTKTPINVRLGELAWISWESTSAVTETQKVDYEILNAEVNDVISALKNIDNEIKTLENKLDELKAPYTPGRMPKK